jgi:hypothetical protein
MNFPGGGLGGGGGLPVMPTGVAAAGRQQGAGAGPAGPGGFDPNDPNVKWVCLWHLLVFFYAPYSRYSY